MDIHQVRWSWRRSIGQDALGHYAVALRQYHKADSGPALMYLPIPITPATQCDLLLNRAELRVVTGESISAFSGTHNTLRGCILVIIRRTSLGRLSEPLSPPNVVLTKIEQ